MFDKSVYMSRRARLKERIKSGLILILGNGEAPANYTDNCFKFRQDSSSRQRGSPCQLHG